MACTRVPRSPKILQAGIDKLQSWQGKMWDVWQLMKSTVKAPEVSPAAMKAAVQQKLQEYKEGMVKIGTILKDRSATKYGWHVCTALTHCTPTACTHHTRIHVTRALHTHARNIRKHT